MKITKKDQEILAAGYESSFYRTFRKYFMEDRQMRLAQDAPFAPDMETIFVTRGRIMELKNIETELKKVYAKQEKTSA